MTLVWLGLILAVIVFGGVFAVWTVRIHTLRSGRLIQLFRERMNADIEALGNDRASREAWAEFLSETPDREQPLLDAMRAEEAMDRLVRLLNDRRQMEVVA